MVRDVIKERAKILLLAFKMFSSALNAPQGVLVLMALPVNLVQLEKSRKMQETLNVLNAKQIMPLRPTINHATLTAAQAKARPSLLDTQTSFNVLSALLVNMVMVQLFVIIVIREHTAVLVKANVLNVLKGLSRQLQAVQLVKAAKQTKLRP